MCLKSREQGRYFETKVSQKPKKIYSLSLPQNAFWLHFQQKVSQKAGSKAGPETPNSPDLSQKCLKSDLHCKFCNFAKIANFTIFAKFNCKFYAKFASCIAIFAKLQKIFQKFFEKLIKSALPLIF